MNLCLALVAAAGLLSLTRVGLVLSGTALLLLVIEVALRTTRMAGLGAPVEWLRSFAVAAAYEAGRALALLGRAHYSRRRAVNA